MNTQHDLAQIETELVEQRAKFTPLGLVMPEDMTLDGWASIGKRLCRAGHMIQWWLGDWAAFGERRYGQLKEFAELNELDYGYLRNLAWVSQKVEASRRRDNLDWAYHQEVAPLPPKDQERWLEKAAVEGFAKAELRQRIRMSKGERCALDRDGPATKSALKSCDDLIHWLKNRPPDFWIEDRRAAWRKNLSPIVDVFHSLG